ncbi:hypothetical protein [Flavitalea sp.]|nr:hypothetical protein [Flavitalea sp.]
MANRIPSYARLRQYCHVVRNLRRDMHKVFIAFLLICISCSDHKPQTSAKKNNGDYRHRITINIDRDAEISLQDGEDSLILKCSPEFLRHYIDSASITTTDSIFSFPVKMQDKDSLFNISESLIDNGTSRGPFCTDYFGYLKVTVIYNEQFMKTATYRSICEWKEYSIDTKRLDNLFKLIFRSRN